MREVAQLKPPELARNKWARQSRTVVERSDAHVGSQVTRGERQSIAFRGIRSKLLASQLVHPLRQFQLLLPLANWNATAHGEGALREKTVFREPGRSVVQEPRSFARGKTTPLRSSRRHEPGRRTSWSHTTQHWGQLRKRFGCQQSVQKRRFYDGNCTRDRIQPTWAAQSLGTLAVRWSGDRRATVPSTATVVQSATATCAVRRLWRWELPVRPSDGPVRAAAAADPAVAAHPAATGAATATTTAAPAYSSAAATSPAPAVASARAAAAPPAAAAGSVAAATAPADPATGPIRAAADPSTPAATAGPADAVRSGDTWPSRSRDVAAVRRSLRLVRYCPGRATSHSAAPVRCSVYDGPSDVGLRRGRRNRTVAKQPQAAYKEMRNKEVTCQSLSTDRYQALRSGLGFLR